MFHLFTKEVEIQFLTFQSIIWEALVVKRGLFHIFAKGLTDLISLRAYWCVSIGACFMQRKKLSIFP